MTSDERRLRLSAELMSVRRGRIFARDVVTGWGLESLADDVQLGVSELITNAVRHAGTDLELCLRLDGRLEIEVRDADPELKHPTPEVAADPLATSGRGLHIVAAVSTDWGVRSTGGGKSVWFAIDRPDATSPDADVYAMRGRRDADADARDDADDTEDGPEESRKLQAKAAS